MARTPTISHFTTPYKRPSQAEDQYKWLRLLFGFLFSGAIGILAYKRRSLSRSGIAGAMLSGTTIFGMGGIGWGLSLIFFFVSSSLLSHFRAQDKALTAADKFSKGSQRDFSQAMANGGVATLLALGYGLSTSKCTRSSLQAGFVGALATANADTWATELGVLSKQPPRLITTGALTTPGTSGGVTLTGTVASAAGAVALGLFFRLFQRGRSALPLIALLSGMLGSVFDSFLGATVQVMYYCPTCHKETERRVHSCSTVTRPLRGIPGLDNDVVNFLATLCGALTAMGMQSLLFRRRHGDV
jgi:uncharacterized protein (TIGR00297 family)